MIAAGFTNLSFRCIDSRSRVFSSSSRLRALRTVTLMMRRRAVKGESPSWQIFLKVRRSVFGMLVARLDSIPSVDCCSTEENAELVKDVQREKESCFSLQRSSELLGPSSPSSTALETDLVVRDNLDRKPSFNGNVLFCS